MYGVEHSKKVERYRKGPLTPYSVHARHYYRRSIVFNSARSLSISPPRVRCLSASKAMDSNNRSASPRESSRPQQKPPSPPLGVDNRAYLPDQDDPNHNQPTNDSFASNTSPQTNGKHDHNGEAKSFEAVNLELINLNPKNGNVQKPMAVKKEVEIDMNASNPYDEYFVPVNEHRKYMRGEKLYVTADKRNEKGGCKRPLCWSLLGLVVAAVVILIVLAATGILFTNTPTPVEEYNSTISSARAFGIGGVGSQDHKNHEQKPNDDNLDVHGHTGQVDNSHDHHNHDHTLHNHEQNNQNQDENVEIKHFSREPNFRSLDEVDEHNQHRPEGVQSDQMHDPNVLVDDINDSALYIPRTIEGELKIDNEQFQAEYEDTDSIAYKEFTSSLSEAIKKAVFNTDTLDNSDNDITVEIVQLKKGSVIVTYRIHWKPKSIHSADTIDIESSSKKLTDYLNKNGRMLNIYHVADEKENLRPVLNICQDNNNNCEHGCEFDYTTLDFKCTCPSGKILHMDNLKTCISLFEESSTEHFNRKVISLNSNQSTSKPIPNEETPATENLYLLSENKDFDWKETSHVDETTTQEIPNLQYSHIFGHPDSKNDSNEAKSEPQPEPKPEPTAEPEPTSEPIAKPEPTSEPESKLKPLAESEPKSEPTALPEPNVEPTSNPTVLPETNAEPTSEPEPKSEPPVEHEPKAEPTAEPHPEPKSEPIPTTEPSPQSEPTGKSESIAYLDLQTFEPTPTSELTAEPTAEPTSEPTAEPTAEPEPVAEPEPIADPESMQNQRHTVVSDVTQMPKQESTTHATIINSETDFKNGTHAENNSEIMFNITSNIMPESIDDLIIKTKNDNTDVPLTFTTILPQLTYKMDELETDKSVIGLHPIEQRHNKIKDKNAFFNNNENRDRHIRNESRPRSFNFDLETTEEAKTEQTTEESKEDTITFDFITQNEKNEDNDNTNNTNHNRTMSKSPFTEIMEAIHEMGNKNEIKSQIPEIKKVNSVYLTDINIEDAAETTTLSHEPHTMRDDQDIIDEMVPKISHDSKHINETTISKLINHKINVGNAKNQSMNNGTTRSFIQNNLTSKLPEESIDITFDNISKLNDTYNKLVTTEKELNSTESSIETTTTSATDSEWLSEPVSEDILNGDRPMNEQITTTEFKIPIAEDMMSQISAKEDFDHEYLNNFALGNRMNEQDVPMYAMPNDYENEDARVKRVNEEFKGINNSSNTDVIKSTTVSQYIFKSNETHNAAKLDESSPAPVWESHEADPASQTENDENESSLRYDNNKSQIDDYDTNSVTKSLSSNTTQASNLNVTIYEISTKNNNSLQPVKSDSNVQPISYVDHDTEMNPFLPEVENNKHLVTKLQEGHDVETINYNETLIANNQDQRINYTESTEIASSKEPPTSSDNLEQNKHENDSANISKEQNISTESSINSNTEKSSDKNYIPISTFLIDTADLPSGKELTTTEGKMEVDSNSDIYTTTSKFVNGEDYLNVVPIKQDKHRNDIETLYNDINDTPKKSDKRTLSKLQSVIDNEA